MRRPEFFEFAEKYFGAVAGGGIKKYNGIK